MFCPACNKIIISAVDASNIHILTGHCAHCEQKSALKQWIEDNKNGKKKRLRLSDERFAESESQSHRVENSVSILAQQGLHSSSQLPISFAWSSRLQGNDRFKIQTSNIEVAENVSNIDEIEEELQEIPILSETTLKESDIQGTTLDEDDAYGSRIWYEFQQQLKKSINLCTSSMRKRVNSDGHKPDFFTDHSLNELKSKLRLSGGGIKLVFDTIKSLNQHNNVSYYVPSNDIIMSSHLDHVLQDDETKKDLFTVKKFEFKWILKFFQTYKTDLQYVLI